MSTPTHILKEEVEAFALSMVYKLGLHKNKGHWSSESDEELMRHLYAEVDELKRAIKTGNRENVCSEAADVANIAMMVHNNAVNGTKSHGHCPGMAGPRQSCPAADCKYGL